MGEMMENKREYQVCTNCVMDTSDSLITFDENGMCDHCHNFYEQIQPNWNPDEKGKFELEKLVKKIKLAGKGKEFDCIIGVSGGVDSSYLLYYAKEVLGLRPLAFACDTGWNLNVAVSNIEKLVKGLKLELFTEVVNWNEMKDLQLAYFKSQVPYQDTPQDHAIFASLYNFAVKNKIKYVITGGNYSTESVREPYEWVYLNDLTQIKDIHNKFGLQKLKTFPLCGMFKYRIYYRYVLGMRAVKPLDLIPYTKAEAIKTLNEKFDWQPYKNKHYESTFTKFYEGFWLIKKFGYDKRRAHFSSLILSGQLTRDDALKILEESPYPEKEIQDDLVYVSKKLGLTVNEFMEIMSQPNKTFKDYKNTEWISKLAIKFAQIVGLEKRQFR